MTRASLVGCLAREVPRTNRPGRGYPNVMHTMPYCFIEACRILFNELTGRFFKRMKDSGGYDKAVSDFNWDILLQWRGVFEN